MSDKVDSSSLSSLSNINQYPNWAAQMKGYLIMIGSWTVTNSAPTTTATTATAEELKEHDLKVQRAQGIIMMKVDRSLHRPLEDDAGNPKQPHAMWKALKDTFGTPDAAAKPIQHQFDQLVTRLKEIKDSGLALPENLQAMLVLSKIPESYRNLISGLLTSVELKDLKVDTVREKTLAYENIQRTGMANCTSATRVSQTKPKKKGPCGHCGGKTHDESSCWKKYPEKKPKGGGNKKDEKGKGKDNGPPHNHSHTTVNESSSANVLVSTTAEASQSISASFYGSSSDDYRLTTWLMDSGASEHITPYFDDFDTYEEFASPMVFGTAAA
ncbi:hypothetical protein DICSQDRAFT_172211, partial [Dichomitus squalens LYAD-421 SS1]